MSDQELAERVVLDRYEPKWVSQGYKVVRDEVARHAPPFLEAYTPDALLLGRLPNVVVEVVHKGQPQTDQKVRFLRHLLSGHKDWRLEVLYAGEDADRLPAVSVSSLRETITTAKTLVDLDRRSSLLLVWATLEAIARRLSPSKTLRPQSPGRVVEVLASEGFVLPSEAVVLREAVNWRNRLVHGDLDVALSISNLSEVISITERLSELVETSEEVPDQRPPPP